MPRIFPRLPNGRADVRLHHMSTTEDVFWSKRANSYVLVDSPEHGEFTVEGRKVQLASINGIGEVRWTVRPIDVERAVGYEKAGKLDPTWDCAEQLDAARHFGLAH